MVTKKPWHFGLCSSAWRGDDKGSTRQVGKHFRREEQRLKSPCLGGRTCAVSGVTWCRRWGHGASDSCWPRATGVYHLQMAVCPSVERHFDCWCSQARPHARSRWHEHAANRDVFFWRRPLMNMKILLEYFYSAWRTFCKTVFNYSKVFEACEAQ